MAMLRFKSFRRSLCAACVAFGALAHAATPTPSVTAEQAWKSLLEGNRAYTAGNFSYLWKFSQPSVRVSLAAGQKPYASVLCCSDSRVPPEIVFDRGLGEIFVVRVAGNVVAPHELGSLEYAAEHIGVPLIVILGHERCGAVTAAVDAIGPVEGNIGSLIESILPAVEAARDSGAYTTREALVEGSVLENIKLVARNILAKSPLLAQMVEEGQVKIVGAKYDLESGKVQSVALCRP